MRQMYQSVMHRMRLIPAKWQLVVAVPFFAALSMAPALGGDSYSFEEQQACTSDAFRLCSEFIPDVPRITACMQEKQDQLSPPCAKMFAPNRDRHLNESGQHPHEAAQPSRNQQSLDQGQPRIPSQRHDFNDPPPDED